MCYYTKTSSCIFIKYNNTRWTIFSQYSAVVRSVQLVNKMDKNISFSGKTKRVLITGFAPFEGLEKNPSWEGVRSMNKEDIERKYNINLFREKIEVRYKDVDICVPKLWDILQPDLTIHVGVSGEASCFLLEKYARKNGYIISDIDGLYPAGNACGSDGAEKIATNLDVEVICKEFKCEPPADRLRAKVSCDAGKYLCEYVYYTSLCRDTSKTLFIHVPLYAYSSEQIAQGLERILEICLRHLRYSEVNNKLDRQLKQHKCIV